MSYGRNAHGLIWTNHALSRLRSRRIPQEYAWKTFRYPDATKPGSAPGSHEYVKRIKDHIVSVVAKKNEKREWIILSAWIDRADTRRRVGKQTTSLIGSTLRLFFETLFGRK